MNAETRCEGSRYASHMPLTDKAPFGSTGAVVKTLETYRETGLGGGPITTAVIGRMGYGNEVARRVILSLRMLEMIDDKGAPTAKLRAFKEAPSTEYREFLADHIYEVYGAVFAVTGRNIGDKSNAEIEDAFRPFKPDSLRKRMVALFLGLCGYVGITDEAPRITSPRPRQAASSRPTSAATAPTPSPAPASPASAAPTAPVGSMEAARARYVDLLIAKAQEANGDVGDLFDRIERVLGVGSEQEAKT